LKDGVRFSIKARDSYLYRAMLDIENQALKETAPLPYKDRSRVLQSLFPNFRRVYKTATPSLVTPTMFELDLPTLAAHVYNVFTFDDTSGNKRPVFFTRGTSTDIIAMQSDRHIVEMDPRYVLGYKADLSVSKVTCYFAFSEQSYVTSGRPDIQVEYLPLPTDPSTQAADDRLYFEEQYMKTVIGRAVAYGRADNDDIQDMNTFIQAIVQ
jgi:hypothetical protein